MKLMLQLSGGNENNNSDGYTINSAVPRVGSKTLIIEKSCQSFRVILLHPRYTPAYLAEKI